MKVLHLVHNFPPEFLGGTERYLSDLVVAQQASGLDVRVICGSERRDRSAEREDWKGVPVLRVFRQSEEAFGVEFDPASTRAAIAEELTRFEPDLLHLHHWFNLGNSLLQQFPSQPAVATFHDAYSACPRFFLLRPDGGDCADDLPVPLSRCESCIGVEDSGPDLAARITSRRATFAAELDRISAAVVPSQHHGEVLVAAGVIPRERLSVLPLGVEAVPRPEREPPSEPLRVVSFGHLSRLKGTDLLLRALARLGEGRVELHLHGPFLDPAEEAELRELASGLAVTFHGPYTLPDLRAAAGAYDVAVFPSRARETYSLVVEEAIGLGLPVVVSDRGALPERVTAGFGRVVSGGEVGPLEAALRELAADRGRVEAMRAELPERPRLLVDHATELRALYDDVLSAPALATGHGEGVACASPSSAGEPTMAEPEYRAYRTFPPLLDLGTLAPGPVLAVAPHPDDEIIGCGGMLAFHCARGDDVWVAQMTGGERGDPKALEEGDLVRVRLEESRAAATEIGLDPERVVGLGFPDGAVDPEGAVEDRLVELLLERRPGIVYAPSPLECHPDHLATSWAVARAVHRADVGARLLCYEVNHPTLASFLCDITPQIERKREALSRFESQQRYQDIVGKCLAGAYCRTVNIALPDIDYAEAFLELDATRAPEIWRDLESLCRKLGIAQESTS